MMYYGYGLDGFGGFHVVGFVLMAAFWAAVIYGVVLVARSLARHDGPRGGRHGDRALEILRERYAKGEISREEFESRKADLS